MKLRYGSLALLLVLASCSSVDSLLNKIDNESEKSIDIACSCTNIFPDQAMCEAQFASFFEIFDRDCLEDALREDTDASKESLECILDQAKTYNTCLEDTLECDDADSFQGCSSVFENECPQLPAAVQIKLQACGDGN